MEPKNAYEEVLSLLPEKCIVSLRDGLANGEYADSDFYKLHDLLERTKETDFYFSTPQMQEAFDSMRAAADELYWFLVVHYFRASIGATCALYPERRDAEYAVKTEEGDIFTWDQLKNLGVQKARQLHDAFVNVVNVYRYKDEVGSQELFWNELAFNEEKGELCFRGEKSLFRSGTNGHWLVSSFFEDDGITRIEKNEFFNKIKGLDIEDGEIGKNKQVIKNALIFVNNKIKRDFHTKQQIFSEDGEYIKRNI